MLQCSDRATARAGAGSAGVRNAARLLAVALVGREGEALWQPCLGVAAGGVKLRLRQACRGLKEGPGEFRFCRVCIVDLSDVERSADQHGVFKLHVRKVSMLGADDEAFYQGHLGTSKLLRVECGKAEAGLTQASARQAAAIRFLVRQINLLKSAIRASLLVNDEPPGGRLAACCVLVGSLCKSGEAHCPNGRNGEYNSNDHLNQNG
jgi:hypothetical protein